MITLSFATRFFAPTYPTSSFAQNDLGKVERPASRNQKRVKRENTSKQETGNESYNLKPLSIKVNLILDKTLLLMIIKNPEPALFQM
jgi:hypothetical protein